MAEKVVYNDPTPNNFPDDYDDSKVDSRVKIRSKSIAHKEYGEHVREALAQGIEISSVVSGEAKSAASDANVKADDTQNRLVDQLAANSDGDINLSEVVDARRPANAAEAYKTIGERMDLSDAQIAEIKNTLVTVYTI